MNDFFANGLRASSSQRTIVFCDFDGTITCNDNIIHIMKHFNPPGWERIKDAILAQQISIREGVGRMFSLLPAARKEEIVRFSVENAEIRPGFREFVEYCRENGIRLLITSGGIDFFVYPILSRFAIPVEDIYCNGSDFSGDGIRILWPHPCDEDCDLDCGMCKTTIIRNYPQEAYRRIVIGDSITDLAGAKLAELVIARDFLLRKCEELGLPHEPFSTFYDVIDILKRVQEAGGMHSSRKRG
ncbi:2-hydroxy-3-keto-5-methylthiopentenyl-1-phosphate phosphatase [Bacillaceae bacterium]